MKQILVIGFIAVCLSFAAAANAAKPQSKRPAARVGAYAGFSLGLGDYTSDQSDTEDQMLNTLASFGTPISPSVSSTTNDIAYNASFGYRFSRYFAAELGMADYGELQTNGKANYNGTAGIVPITVNFTFKLQGPVMSGVAILPINEKFELFGRVGVMFASSSRLASARINGDAGPRGEARGDSQEIVLGLGAAFNINQAWAVRAEYQRLGEVGDASKTGEEELQCATLGFIRRF